MFIFYYRFEFHLDIHVGIYSMATEYMAAR